MCAAQTLDSRSTESLLQTAASEIQIKIRDAKTGFFC